MRLDILLPIALLLANNLVGYALLHEDSSDNRRSTASIPAPTDSLNGMCTTLQVFQGSSSVGFASRTTDGYSFTSDASHATPFLLVSTLLSRYQLFDNQGNRAYMSVLNWVMPGTSYGDRADWIFTISGSRYQVQSLATSQYLGSFFFSLGAGGSSYTVALAPATGCAAAPDIATGITGNLPANGVNAQGKLVGVMDMHSHLTAGAAFGGDLHCGDAWALGGADDALPSDCVGHGPLSIGAILEGVLGGTSVINVSGFGWPSFTQWPTSGSELHEQAYYRSIERAYLSGIRVINTLLVANRVICDIFPDKKSSCDEMDQIRAQATFLSQMQEYIDGQSGGAGKGWFRIATSPAAVRSIVAANQLAVIVGVENSELFGCSGANVSACTTEVIDAGLDELVSLGISGLFPVHKFDNAFGGTRMDPGIGGAFINIANLVSSGHFWELLPCSGAAQDQPQPITNQDFANLLAGGIVNVPSGTVLPVYPPGPQCNIQNLSTLGQYLINGMMKRGLIIHIDHMSVKTAGQALDLIEANNYPGLLSEHSWSDLNIVDRILALGGVVGIYTFNTTNFVEAWRSYKALPHGSRVTAIGLGSDVNGLGPLPPARTDAATNPFQYPFTTLTGTVGSRQALGSRTYDINTDGVAEYGMYAEWMIDAINEAGADGPELKAAFLGSAEAYVSMWEKTVAWKQSHANDENTTNSFVMSFLSISAATIAFGVAAVVGLVALVVLAVFAQRRLLSRPPAKLSTSGEGGIEVADVESRV